MLQIFENLTDYEFNSTIFIANLKESDQIERHHLIAAIIWLFIVIFGLLGNGMLIFVILKLKQLANVTKCYIFNLAIADTSFLIFCVSTTAFIYIIDCWPFGRFLCKMYHYLSFVRLNSSFKF